ncbi:PAS domain-containing protein [bacterium]|nr:PAS domain-containing protein [bacterium]
MTHKNTLKFRILATLFTGVLIGLTTICGFWLHSEQKFREQETRQQVIWQKNNAVGHLAEHIQRHVKTANIIAHSLSLRRYVISHAQSIMQYPTKTRSTQINKQVDYLRSLDHTSSEYIALTKSLEADYLRSIIAFSGNVIDQIIVTDSFGFVRISTHTPDEPYVFYSEWWQRALKIRQNQVYQYSEISENTGFSEYLVLPLYNDEGINAVGVIQLRLNLNLLFANTQQSLRSDNPATFYITDHNQIYPPVTSFSPFSIGELITFAQQPSKLFTDNTRRYVLGKETLIGKTIDIIPDLKWSVISFQLRPTVFSMEQPVFRKALTLWFIGILFLFMLSYIVSIWITDPLHALIIAISEIAAGNFHVRIPVFGKGEFSELSEVVNQLAQSIEESSSSAARSLRESHASISAFEDFTQESALEHDRHLIADSLLRLSIRKLNADAGVLIIHNPDYKSPMVLKYNISDEQIDRFDSLKLHGVNSKQIYFAWDHPEFQTIWDDDFQVLLATPIRTRQSRFGTLYILFYQVISTDMEKDRTIELLAQQAAVYSSRSDLFHQLDRQISFTEGILSGIPWFICTLDSQMNITWHNFRSDYLQLSNVKDLINSKCFESFRNRKSFCPDCPAKQTLTDGKQHEIVQRWISRDDSIRWVKVNSFPFMDETKQMRSTILFIRDITPETQTQSEIRQFSRAVDNIGEAVIITNMEGQIVFTNKAFLRIFNFVGHEINGSPIQIVFPRENSAVYHEILSTIRKDKIWTHEMDLIKNNKELVKVSITASLVRDESGLPIGQVYTCFDISKRIKREKQLIDRYRELEVLHKINNILTTSHELRELLSQILEHISEFAGCSSGTIMLFDLEDHVDERNINVTANPAKPEIFAEKDLPGFFVKYIEEIRQGRKSNLFNKLSLSNIPIIFNNIKPSMSVDAKLIVRMGFHSMLSIPVMSAQNQLGLILLFSSPSFHFNTEMMDIYKSISTQLGISIHGRYLQAKLIAEAKYTLTGEIVSRIGSDVKQVLQGLEKSSRSIENSLSKKSWFSLEKGWMDMSRQIWHLYQTTLNILDYGSENQRLFFPENLNLLIDKCIAQFTKHSFSKRIDIHFQTNDIFPEVYINKIAIQRAITNLLILSIEACWFSNNPQVTIKIHDIGDTGDQYAVDISHNVTKSNQLETDIMNYRNGAPVSTLPILLSSLIRSLQTHGGSLVSLHSSELKSVYRIVLPRYPDRLHVSEI